jgi:transmembrane sensor
MSTFESSRSIDQAASDWTARLDREPLSPAEEANLEAWLQSDVRHRGALLRAQAIAMKSESAQALGPQFDPADFADPEPVKAVRFSRRRILTWTGSAALGAAIIALGISAPATGTTISTGRGELRLVPLNDGSTVMLNTDTSIRIRYGTREKVVTLLKGEAYFSIARNGTDPLVVEVDGRRLITTQATLDIRKLEGAPVDLLVHQGLVRLAAPSWGDSHMVAVKSNMRVLLTEPHMFQPSALERPLPVSPDAATRGVAWLEGKISFEGETLQAAADEFARYNNTQIVIHGSDLAREPITGLFAANDPAGFSRAAAGVLNAKLERTGDTIVLSRAATPR